MRIKNRLSPYPILNDFGDDYVNSSFEVEYNVEIQFAEIYGNLIFHLVNDEIQDLIEKDYAEYVVHIECPSTCFRKIVSSREKEIEFKLDSSNVSKVIEIRTFVVLKKDIRDFKSKNFHPDYEGESFDLAAHQIIAIGTAKNYDILRDDREMDSFPSIFQIVKLTDKKKGSLSVNTDEDAYILVGLSEEIYEKYARLGKSIYKSTAFALTIFPALIIVLERMHANKDDPDMVSRHWYQVIESLLEKNGFDIDDITLDNDSLMSVCQSIFADPIARSFEELDRCSERM